MHRNEKEHVHTDPMLEQRLAYARTTVPKARARTLHETILAAQRTWRARARQQTQIDASLDAVLDAWIRVFPDEVSQTCRPARLARGTLVVHCADDGARHAIDRALRNGALNKVKDAVPDVRTVRVLVRPSDVK